MAGESAANGYLRGVATFIVVVLTIACLYWARSVLMPVALSILLTFILAPVVNRVQQVGLWRAPAVIVVVSIVGLLSLGAVWVISVQIAGLVSDLPNYQDNIAQKISDIRDGRLTRFYEDFQSFVHQFNQRPPGSEMPQLVQVVSDNPVSAYGAMLSMLNPLLEPIATAGLVIVLVIFMLINREDLRNRVITLAGSGQMALTTRALDESSQRISRYLLMQLIINSSYGAMLALALLVLGVPYALLWGLLAAVLRYIPYLGPWLAAIMPIALSVAVLDGWYPALLVIGMFIILELFSNMVMEPLLYGQSVGVSEASLLVAVAFWTWLWGAIGLVLSVPLTVCLVILGKYVPALKFFDVLLGEPPCIQPHNALYQRLLAHDQDEALEIVQEQLKTKNPAVVCDTVLLPSLIAARRDLQADHVQEADFQELLKGTREVIVALGTEESLLRDNQESVGEETPALDERPALIGCAVRDESDEVALHMLQHVLDSQTVRSVLVPDDQPLADVVAMIEEQKPALVLLTALPPGGLATTCLFCRRLRSRFPKLAILVGRWGLGFDQTQNMQQLREAGATHIGLTIQESLDQIHRILEGATKAEAVALRN